MSPKKRGAREAETPDGPDVRRVAPKRSPSGPVAGGVGPRPWYLRWLPEICFHVREPNVEKRVHSTSNPMLKNVTGEYVHAMFHDVIRDGEINESEQSMMLWAIIISAQIHASGAGVNTITIPSTVRKGEGALRSYVQAHRAEINDFMKLVKSRAERQWIQPLSPEQKEHKQGILAGPLTVLTDQVIGLIGYRDQKSLSDFSAEELLSAFEKPDELKFHWTTSAILNFLEPLAPSKYLFRLRVVDLVKFYGAKRSEGGLRRSDWSTVLKGFFFVMICLGYTFLLGLVIFLRTLLYLRVFLCVGMGIPLIDQGACAVNFLVEQWTEWDHSNAWVGCPKEGSSSFQLLSGALAQLILELLALGNVVIPCVLFVASFCIVYRPWCVNHGLKPEAAALLCALLTAVLARPAWSLWVWTAGSASELILLDDVLGSVHVFLRKVLDFCFTVLLVNILGMLNGAMDEIVQPKLLLASLRLGAELRG